MKKFITLMVLTIMFVPTVAMADMVKSNDGSMLVEEWHNREVSCLWYLPNYRHMLKDWQSKVNSVIAERIEEILQK